MVLGTFKVELTKYIPQGTPSISSKWIDTHRRFHDE